MKTMKIGFKVKRPDLFDGEPQMIVIEVSGVKDDVTYDQIAEATIKETIVEFTGLSHVLTAEDLQIIPADQFDEEYAQLSHMMEAVVTPDA